MANKTKIVKRPSRKAQSEQKLKKARTDYLELMTQVEPFIVKSDIVITSTEGKWYDTTTTLVNVIPHNSIYR